MGDRDLIEALRDGRPQAWEDFLSRYLRLLAHIVRRTLQAYGVLHADADVEDLTYELLQTLVKDRYKALAGIGEPYDLKAYVAVAARRKAIDFARRPKGAPLSLDQPVGDDEGTFADRVAAPEAEPDAAPPQALRAVQEAMRRLPPRERLLVRLFYLKNMKYRDIARATGVPMNSIGPTIGRAVAKLQEQLK